jgi:hypothetical protein
LIGVSIRVAVAAAWANVLALVVGKGSSQLLVGLARDAAVGSRRVAIDDG